MSREPVLLQPARRISSGYCCQLYIVKPLLLTAAQDIHTTHINAAVSQHARHYHPKGRLCQCQTILKLLYSVSSMQPRGLP